MSLTAVIPAHNDGASLNVLLRQISESGIFSDVIVVDDASAPPLAPQLPDGSTVQMRLIRQDQQGGAGRARNLAFEHVETDYLLCLDADDAITPELSDLWHDLDEQIRADKEIDFCLFRHCDSRVLKCGGWDQTAQDDVLWMAAGALNSPLAPTIPNARGTLARTSNYPWNKIYKTAFVRQHNLKCSETIVHNDIALHWRSMILGQSVWTSNRVCVVHGIEDHGGRLTNRGGSDRLEVFDALADAQPDITANHQWLIPWLDFVTGLFDWIHDRLDSDTADIFFRRRRTYLLETVSLRLFETVLHQNPQLALRLARQSGIPC